MIAYLTTATAGALLFQLHVFVTLFVSKEYVT